MITQECLKSELDYDPITGYFTRKVSKTPTVQIGQRAGSVNGNGYRQILIQGEYVQEHTLVWIYMYGNLPTYQIDHINHNKEDNSLLNLRDIPHSVNVKNKPKYKSNKSGITGVIWEKDREKWSAYITLNKSRIRLGSFESLEDAISVRKQANLDYGFHPNHGELKYG